MDSQKRNIWLTFAAVVVFIALVVGMFVNRILTPRVLHNAELKANGTYVLDKPRILEPFRLVDQDGQPFTNQDLEGKWSLVFFGFTFCPDVCPTTLAELREFKNIMADSEFIEDPQVILASVDPARDTPEQLKQYLNYFDPEFVGITGDFMTLQVFANNVNAAFAKAPGQGENYLVDHTANVVIINPYGHYHGFFRAPLDPGRMKLTYQSVRMTFDG